MTTMHWSTAKKTVAVCAVIGLGLLVVTSRRRWHDHNGAPIALDPELDPDTRRVVLTAIAHETDPSVLGLLATKLDAAGYDKSAKVVQERALQISHMNVHVGQREAD